MLSSSSIQISRIWRNQNHIAEASSRVDELLALNFARKLKLSDRNLKELTVEREVLKGKHFANAATPGTLSIQQKNEIRLSAIEGLNHLLRSLRSATVEDNSTNMDCQDSDLIDVCLRGKYYKIAIEIYYLRSNLDRLPHREHFTRLRDELRSVIERQTSIGLIFDVVNSQRALSVVENSLDMPEEAISTLSAALEIERKINRRGEQIALHANLGNSFVKLVDNEPQSEKLKLWLDKAEYHANEASRIGREENRIDRIYYSDYILAMVEYHRNRMSGSLDNELACQYLEKAKSGWLDEYKTDKSLVDADRVIRCGLFS